MKKEINKDMETLKKINPRYLGHHERTKSMNHGYTRRRGDTH
jgi:hypothetical protein